MNVLSTLTAIEAAINSDETGDTLAILQNARGALGADTCAPVAAATEPTTDETRGWSVGDCIENVRVELFASTAIVDIARRAISSDDDWYLHHALERVVAQLDSVCTDLELIALDARALQGDAVNKPINAFSIAGASRLDAADFELILRALDLLDRHAQAESANKQDAAAIDTRSRIPIVRAKVRALQGGGQ